MRTPWRLSDITETETPGSGALSAETTRPEIVHEFLSDLYRYELRRLRDRLRSGEIPKEGYIDRVVELRLKYPLVSLKPHQLVQ